RPARALGAGNGAPRRRRPRGHAGPGRRGAVAFPFGAILVRGRHAHAARQALSLRHMRDRGPLQQGGHRRPLVLRSRHEAQGSEAASVVRLTPADWIFENGRVLTMDATRPAATALALRDGRVLAVGSAAELRRLAGPRTERV